MRVAIAGVLCVMFSVACAGPYTGTPDKLVMPKKKKAKPKPADAGPAEPDTCKADFTASPVTVSKSTRRTATGYAQDADNLMAGIETAAPEQKRAMVLDALSTLSSALKMDPYNPTATFTMAVAYAWVGKRKCAVMMIERLADLVKIPEVADDTMKFKGKVKKHPSFEPFRKDAEGALGD